VRFLNPFLSLMSGFVHQAEVRCLNLGGRIFPNILNRISTNLFLALT
jgi:hypothetical protein